MPVVNCKEGMTHCFAMFTDNNGGKKSWNRGCCNQNNADDFQCWKQNHEVSESFERWRKTCQYEECNVFDPRGNDQSNSGILIVEGKSAAPSSNAVGVCFLLS